MFCFPNYERGYMRALLKEEEENIYMLLASSIFIYIFRIEIALQFGLPNNQIALHFSVPDTKFLCHWELNFTQYSRKLMFLVNKQWLEHQKEAQFVCWKYQNGVQFDCLEHQSK